MSIPVGHIKILLSIIIHTNNRIHVHICIPLTINHKSPCHTLYYTYTKPIQNIGKEIEQLKRNFRFFTTHLDANLISLFM